MTTDFFSETMQVGRQWNNIFKVLKEQLCQTQILFLETEYFRNKGELKTFSVIQKLKEFIIS